MNIPEPKYKRCACTVRLFRWQGESEEAFALRTTCPRCALKAIHELQESDSAIQEAAEDRWHSECLTDAQEGN